VRARPAAGGGVDSRAAAGVPAPAAAPVAEAPAADDGGGSAAPAPPLEFSDVLSPAHLVLPSVTKSNAPRTLILTNLAAAAIDLRPAGTLSSASIRTGTRSIVVLPRVNGAVRIAGLTRAIVLLAGAAGQIRIHDCTDCDFYIRTGKGAPVVEGVRRVRFAPAPAGGRREGEEKEEEGEVNHWYDVQDFEWRKATQSPNWSILPDGQRLGPKVWDLFREGTATETLLSAVGLGKETTIE
jgi:hypothetical protein